MGISLGLSVAATIRALTRARPKKNCRILRLQGAADFEIMEGTNLAQTLAEKVHGESMIIHSPWLLPSVELCNAIMEEPSVKRALEIAENADIGLVGMGSMDPSHSTILKEPADQPV